MGDPVIEPVIAWDRQDQVALADILVLHTMDCRDFARWPGLAMLVCPQGRRLVIVTRDGARLTVHCESIVDALRIVYLWWSFAGQLVQPGPDRTGAGRER